MADAKRITILNQREGKVVLSADPDELKANPKAAHRTLLAGQTIEVSAEEAPKLLRYKGLVDASKLVASGDSAEVKRLKADLAAALAKNAKLEGDAAGSAADLGDGDAVLLPDGGKGVIVSIKGKTAKVKLENGNVSPFKLSDLKADPDAVQG